MPTTSNDDWKSGMTDFQRGEVERLESMIVSFHKRWDSLEAEERECKARCKALLAERDALKARVAELGTSVSNLAILNGQLSAQPSADRDRDLRERLDTTLAWMEQATGMLSQLPHMACSRDELLKRMDRAETAAMRKGEADD